MFEQIQLVWQKMTLVQRALIIAAGMACVVTAAVLTRWAGQPNLVLLYQQLSPTDAGKITDKLSEAGIPYELRGGGTSIYIPDDRVHKARLDLAKSGLPEGSGGGYKLFDDQKIGVSPFVQSVNLNRALQDELANSIQMIDGVLAARVHLVRPEQTLFADRNQKTSASVVLRLRGGHQLSGGNIAAVTHLVAGSVEGLKAENVTIVDSQGRLLSNSGEKGIGSGASTYLEYKDRVESSLGGKVEDMLAAVLGPGRASVRVSALLDMKSVSLLTEQYDPQKVSTKEEITSRTKAQPGGGEVPVTVNTEREETISTDFLVSKTVTQTIETPGQIQSLTVSAAVDLFVKVDGEADAAATAGEMIMSVEQVRALITNALGLREGVDSIEVVNTRFHRPEEQVVEAAAPWIDYVAMAKQASLGIMAVCALLALKMFGPRKSKIAAGGAGQAALGGEGAAVAMLPEASVMRSQIIGALQSNPDHVRKMFMSWLQEKQEA